MFDEAEGMKAALKKRKNALTISINIEPNQKPEKTGSDLAPDAKESPVHEEAENPALGELGSEENHEMEELIMGGALEEGFMSKKPRTLGEYAKKAAMEKAKKKA